jgi:hypothetical protein
VSHCSYMDRTRRPPQLALAAEVVVQPSERHAVVEAATAMAEAHHEEQLLEATVAAPALVVVRELHMMISLTQGPRRLSCVSTHPCAVLLTQCLYHSLPRTP